MYSMWIIRNINYAIISESKISSLHSNNIPGCGDFNARIQMFDVNIWKFDIILSLYLVRTRPTVFGKLIPFSRQIYGWGVSLKPVINILLFSSCVPLSPHDLWKARDYLLYQFRQNTMILKTSTNEYTIHFTSNLVSLYLKHTDWLLQ
jgi:hypothetical protein